MVYDVAVVFVFSRCLNGFVVFHVDYKSLFFVFHVDYGTGFIVFVVILVIFVVTSILSYY